MTTPKQFTHHGLTGVRNFRDFGGYAAKAGLSMKSGILFRSARLSELTAEDQAKLQEIGPRLIVDLRRRNEASLSPTKANWQDGPRTLNAPLLLDEAGPSTLERVLADPDARINGDKTREIMIELYRELVRLPTALEGYRIIFEALADPAHYPVIVHCSGGKDRTGLVCALIQGLVGVSRDDIIRDFMLSAEAFDESYFAQRIPQVIDVSALGEWSVDGLRPILTVEQVYIETALDLIEAEYGSFEAYLTGPVGLPVETLLDVETHVLA